MAPLALLREPVIWSNLLFLGERMTPASAVGSILILAGVIIAGQRKLE